MRLAVTDTCIFIDLDELELTDLFFLLPFEIHTSLDVFNELFESQKEKLQKWISTSKLSIHSISGEERFQILNENYSISLSETDKTVLFLAKKLDAVLLSSDRVIRNNAKVRSIEYHGILWIIDQLLNNKLIDNLKAVELLNDLKKNNIMFSGNRKLVIEINNRLKAYITR
jgi:predicted nucleic acid-binding protein